MELTLLVRLGAPLMATRGYGSAEVEEVYRRALALGDGLGDMTQLFEALYGIFRMHLLRAEYDIALDVAERLGSLAARADASAPLTIAAYRAAGSVRVYYGDDKAETLRALSTRSPPTPQQRDTAGTARRSTTSPTRGSPAGRTRPGRCGCVGRTAEANEMSDSAIDAARALGHPFTIALALSFDAWLRQFQGDVDGVRRRAEEAGRFAAEQGFTFWTGWASIMRGWAIGVAGDAANGRRR